MRGQRVRRAGAAMVAAAVVAGVAGLRPAAAATDLWSGATDASWDTATNWSLGAEPTAADDALFPTPIPGTGGTITLTAGETANSLTFRNAYALTGGDLALGTAGTVTVAPTFTATVGSALIGTGGLTLAAANGLAAPDDQLGGGTLVLSGTNTYAGATTINAGTLSVSADTNLGTAPAAATAGSLTFNGGTLAATASFTLGTTRGVALTGAGTFNTVGSGTTLSYGGVIAGSGALTKAGAGSLSLTGNNTYAGATTIAGGILNITAAANLGATPASPVATQLTLDGGTLRSVATVAVALPVNRGIFVTANGGGFTNTATVELRINGLISGPGALTLTATGTANTVIDKGDNAAGVNPNTYSGGTIIAAGSATGAIIPIQSSAGTANNPTSGPFGIGPITFAGGTFRPTSVGAVTLHNRIVLAGNTNNISGGAALTFLGDVTISGATRTFSNSDDSAVTFSGVISDGGSGFGFTKGGTGTGPLVLTGLNTYSGPTTINGGVLSVPTIGNGSVPSPLGQSSAAASNVVFNGGTLTYTGASATTARGFTLTGAGGITVSATGANLVVAGNLTGSGTFTGTGAGTTTPSSLALTADNTGFTGGVTIANGLNLLVTAVNQLGSGATKTLSNTNGTNNGTFFLDPGPAGSLDFPAGWSVTASSATAQNTFNNLSGTNVVRGNVTMAAGGGGTNLLSTAGRLTFLGTFTPNTTGRNLDLRGAGDGEIAGVIANGPTLGLPVTKSTGTGTWTLSGANTYSGGTTVSAGTLRLGNPAALGNSLNQIVTATNADRTTIAATATLDLNGQSAVRKLLVISGTGVGGAGALVNNGATPASLDGSGALAGLFITGTATGLSAPPTLSFSGGGGTGATATTTLGVTAANFAVAGGTTVYSAAPTVTITGGGGAGATATATLTAGVVSSITITNAGTGFTTAPTIAFTGGTVTTTGTNPTGTGNATNFVLAGARLVTAGTGYTSAPTVTAGSGAATFATTPAGVQLAADSSVGGTGNITLPLITGGFGLTKVGSGNVTLTGANTYTGTTAISAGTLGGTGSIAGPLTVAGGATVQGGTDAAAAGTFSVAGAATLSDASIVRLTLGAAGAHSTLALAGGAATFDSDQAFTFADVGATATTYDNVITGLAANPGTTAGWTILTPGFSGTFSYDGLGNVDLTLSAVPEPATAGVLGVAAVGLLARRRRR
jgi:fibronectin-binding autotransporter adhesin